jgi:death-on-curing protein
VNAETWSDLVTIERVHELHAEGIRRYGGETEIMPRPGCLEGSIGNAWTAELYREDGILHRGLVFAGFVLFYLAKNHCFVDGNKRVAWLTAMQVLLRLSLTIEATTDESETLVNDIIRGQISSGDEVVLWFFERLVAVPFFLEPEQALMAAMRTAARSPWRQ